MHVKVGQIAVPQGDQVPVRLEIRIEIGDRLAGLGD
jgi:hypothetical protein